MFFEEVVFVELLLTMTSYFLLQRWQSNLCSPCSSITLYSKIIIKKQLIMTIPRRRPAEMLMKISDTTMWSGDYLRMKRGCVAFQVTLMSKCLLTARCWTPELKIYRIGSQKCELTTYEAFRNHTYRPCAVDESICVV